MNREEALAKLEEIAKNTDTEHAHVEADRVLMELLNDLGYDDVVAAYDAIDKWFA